MMATLINSDLYLTHHPLDNPSLLVKLFEYSVKFCPGDKNAPSQHKGS